MMWQTLLQYVVTYLSYSMTNVRYDANITADAIDSGIKLYLNDIANAIQDHYYRKMEVLEIQKLPDELSEGRYFLFNMKENIINSKTTKELFNEVNDVIKKLNISVSRENVLSIANKEEYLNFSRMVSEKKLNTESLEWIDPFESVIKYLSESEKWYKFLNSLYAKFSEYEILKYREKYNVDDIEDWGKSGKPQGLIINKNTGNTFEKFLEKIAEYNLTEYDSMKNITISELQLKELNQVLNLTLNHKLMISCEKPFLILKADYYKVEFLEFAYLVIDDSCQNLEGINSIKVFVLNTIFIAEDVKSDIYSIPITIIAPKWEIIGNRIIESKGSNGNATKSKENDGVYPGNKGEDGKPGEPGGPGAPFLGIGEKFINGENLTIISNGGIGGRGQDGGNGQIGRSGRDAIMPFTLCAQFLCSGGKKINDFSCQNMNCNAEYMYIGFIPIRVLSDCTYKLFGMAGEPGGDGGNGGTGGKGGNAGNIELFEIGDSSGISKLSSRGNNGENGIAGMGAVGGSKGNDIIVTCHTPDVGNFNFKTTWNLKQTIPNTKIRYTSGKNGTDGANERGIQNPEEAAIIQEPAKSINEYKSYLRENLNNRFKKHSLTQFLDKLNDSNKVKSVYNTLELVNEMLGLEKQFHMLNKDELFSFYQSLLNRISEYAKYPKESENSIQYKKVLSYLYAAVVSRMHYLKEISEPSLIIDISGYLDLVKKDIEALKDLQNEKNKADIINQYKENYKSNIDKKIDEAKKFIKKQIEHEIDNINTQIDSKIDLLVNETIELQHQAKTEEKELIKKKQELEKTLELRGLFSCFKILGLITSFLGPVGEIVGTVVGAVSTIAESLVLDKQSVQQQISNLPPGIASNLRLLGDKIKKAKNEKVTFLNKFLDEVSQEIKKNPAKLGDLSAKVAAFRATLNTTLKDNKFDFKRIQALEDELNQELKRKEEYLKTQVSDKEIESAKLSVKKFSQIIRLGFDIYNKYKDDSSKLDAITNAIDQAENTFLKLREYEGKIYTTIFPMLKNMEQNLNDVAKELDTKSQVALDITKWQVQDTLKDMKLQMRQFTQGFQVGNDLERCIAKLEDAMTTLINVYDRIQNYKEQQNLANYIADLSSAAASSIIISNSNLSNAVKDLDILIRSNLVLKEYKNAIDAFKQWVFPFANYYLEKISLPSHLKLNNNIQNLVLNVAEQIESIKSKLDEYKKSVKAEDKYIRNGEFNSRYVSTEPFFIWKQDQNKNIISKLLSGQGVIVKADVIDSAFDKDAIKFSFLELIIKSQNATLQSKLNDTLKGFDITATHLGNSYYRFDNTIYVTTSESQSIYYSFEKNDAGEPLRTNGVYNKIKKGDLMLSPYAVWEVTLTNSTNKISFHELEMYKDDVNLELSGYGSYVVRGLNSSSLKVEDYYKAIDTYNLLEMNTEPKIVSVSDITQHDQRYIYTADQVD